jgi:hypothetical protein
MVDKILKNLDHVTKLKSRLVCKKWQTFVDKTVAFRPILCSETRKYVANSKVEEFDKLIVVNLDFDGLELMPFKKKIKHLTFGTGNEPVIVRTILQFRQPESITSLTLGKLLQF